MSTFQMPVSTKKQRKLTREAYLMRAKAAKLRGDWGAYLQNRELANQGTRAEKKTREEFQRGMEDLKKQSKSASDEAKSASDEALQIALQLGREAARGESAQPIDYVGMKQKRKEDLADARKLRSRLPQKPQKQTTLEQKSSVQAVRSSESAQDRRKAQQEIQKSRKEKMNIGLKEHEEEKIKDINKDIDADITSPTFNVFYTKEKISELLPEEYFTEDEISTIQSQVDKLRERNVSIDKVKSALNKLEKVKDLPDDVKTRISEYFYGSQPPMKIQDVEQSPKMPMPRLLRGPSIDSEEAAPAMDIYYNKKQLDETINKMSDPYRRVITKEDYSKDYTAKSSSSKDPVAEDDDEFSFDTLSDVSNTSQGIYTKPSDKPVKLQPKPKRRPPSRVRKPEIDGYMGDFSTTSYMDSQPSNNISDLSSLEISDIESVKTTTDYSTDDIESQRAYQQEEFVGIQEGGKKFIEEQKYQEEQEDENVAKQIMNEIEVLSGGKDDSLFSAQDLYIRNYQDLNEDEAPSGLQRGRNARPLNEINLENIEEAFQEEKGPEGREEKWDVGNPLDFNIPNLNFDRLDNIPQVIAGLSTAADIITEISSLGTLTKNRGSKLDNDEKSSILSEESVEAPIELSSRFNNINRIPMNKDYRERFLQQQSLPIKNTAMINIAGKYKNVDLKDVIGERASDLESIRGKQIPYRQPNRRIRGNAMNLIRLGNKTATQIDNEFQP